MRNSNRKYLLGAITDSISASLCSLTDKQIGLWHWPTRLGIDSLASVKVVKYRLWGQVYVFFKFLYL